MSEDTLVNIGKIKCDILNQKQIEPSEGGAEDVGFYYEPFPMDEDELYEASVSPSYMDTLFDISMEPLINSTGDPEPEPLNEIEGDLNWLLEDIF